ncbi:MAG: helix-turn-helix domain-containing protein [Acidobacteriota bacterium]|nr:helix-turn-helix domain-containing protein [Acidobacteriota bacterium]
MSKKSAKSERSVDLPDWADDVTPADEVMRKFYAPTGAFKHGPIVPSKLDPQPLLPEAPRESTAPPESLQKLKIQRDIVGTGAATHYQTPVSSPREKPRDKLASTAQTSVTGILEEKEITSLPPSTVISTEPIKDDVAADKSKFALKSGVADTRQVSARDISTSYEDFARKWKMYLYPGQLAVMRILYELTYAVGVTECFTRYSEIASATKMSRRNCINVVNSLANRGFIVRLEVRNDASAKGIRLRVILEPAT